MGWQLPSGYRPRIYDDLDEAGLSPQSTPGLLSGRPAGGTIYGWQRAMLALVATAIAVGMVHAVISALGCEAEARRSVRARLILATKTSTAIAARTKRI